MRARLLPNLVGVAIGLWAVVACGAVFAYTSHATRAGTNAAAPASWPLVPLGREVGRMTLLVFMHPMCPCSRSTLRELERILARAGDSVATRVVFMRSMRTGADPRASSLWNAAAHVPGVVTSVDEDGAVARAFGAATSGQTLLYGTDGGLLFVGGITQPGGHEGDNAGRDALEDLVAGNASAPARTSVFGCPLQF